jgi:hypothetical protein
MPDHSQFNTDSTYPGRRTITFSNSIAFWQRGRGHNHQPRGRGKKSSKHIKILYVDRPQFATLLLPLTSTGFYPDGNSPGKSMENSGKQNPKMGFKSPPEHIVPLHATFKWLKFKHLRHESFYVKNVIHITIRTIMRAKHGFLITSDNPVVREVDPRTRHPFYGDHVSSIKPWKSAFPSHERFCF